LLGLGHPDFLERPLGLRVLALGQPVQDIGGLMDPTALAAGLRPHLLDCLPEASAPSATAIRALSKARVALGRAATPARIGRSRARRRSGRRAPSCPPA